MAIPTIIVAGAWANISGVTTAELDACLAAPDPNREHILAYREDRWDGMVRLYEGNRFPAGLVPHVLNYYADQNRNAKCLKRANGFGIDTSRFNEGYLKCEFKPDFKLHWYQVEAVQKVFDYIEQQFSGCCIKSPTGSGKSVMIACIARYLYEEKGWRSLILVPKVGLAGQLVGMLRDFFGSTVSVGQCGDGHKTVGDITVANPQTLIHYKKSMRRLRGKGMMPVPADPVLAELMQNHEVLFLDETHHASSFTWTDISMVSGALVRVGVSGTPLVHQELRDLKMIGATGPVIYEVKAEDLIESGHVAKPIIFMVMADNASGPDLAWDWAIRTHKDGSQTRYKRYAKYAEAYVEGVVKNDHHNTAVVRATQFFVDRKLQTLVLTRRKEHWLELRDRLEASGIAYRAVWGDTDTTTRSMVKEMLNDRTIQCVLASTIWDEGEDVPGIEAVVLAEGVKVNTSALQRIGRGMRRKEGDNVVYVVDFAPTCHPKLLEHAQQRAIAYESEGYDVELVESWPAMDDTDYDLSKILKGVAV